MGEEWATWLDTEEPLRQEKGSRGGGGLPWQMQAYCPRATTWEALLARGRSIQRLGPLSAEKKRPPGPTAHAQLPAGLHILSGLRQELRWSAVAFLESLQREVSETQGAGRTVVTRHRPQSQLDCGAHAERLLFGESRALCALLPHLSCLRGLPEGPHWEFHLLVISLQGRSGCAGARARREETSLPTRPW